MVWIFSSSLYLHSSIIFTISEIAQNQLLLVYRSQTTVDNQKNFEKIKKSFSKYKNCYIEVYPSTDHGFAFPERNTYAEEAAEIHWKKLIHLFDKNLKKK